MAALWFGKRASDIVDAIKEGLLEKSHVGAVPRREDWRNVRAIANGAIVGVALNAIPGDVRNAMDAGNLVVGQLVVLIHPMVVVDGEQEKVPLSWIVLKLTDLQTRRQAVAGAGNTIGSLGDDRASKGRERENDFGKSVHGGKDGHDGVFMQEKTPFVSKAVIMVWVCANERAMRETGAESRRQ